MRFWRILVLILTGALILGVVAGCDNDTRQAEDKGSVPAVVPPDDANKLPDEIHQLRVGITDGQFDRDVYETLPGATQLVITTAGGPYTLQITNLVAPQPLPADGETTIGFNTPTTGEYMMELTGAPGRATLNIRPPGGE